MSADPARRRAPDAGAPSEDDGAPEARAPKRPRRAAPATAERTAAADRAGDDGAAAVRDAGRIGADQGPAADAEVSRGQARRAAEEAGRRSSARPAASLLAIAPKPRRRRAEPPTAADAPTSGKRDLTEILRTLNDPPGADGLPETPAVDAPALAPPADAAPSAEAPPSPLSTPPVVRLTPVAPPPADPAESAAPPILGPTDPADAAGIPRAAEAPPVPASEATAAAPAHADPTDGASPADRPVDARSDDPTGRAPSPRPTDVEAQTSPASDDRRAPARDLRPAPATPSAAPSEPVRSGWRGLAARAARVVAGSRSRDADAVARRQEAVVAGVRQRDEAATTRPVAATAAPGAPGASGANGGASGANGGASGANGGASGPGRPAGPRAAGSPAEATAGDGDPPVALLRRGEHGLVGARRMRPGPRGPEDLIRLWLERRGPRTVPAWSSFPASLIGAQWPNSLLLTLDPEAAPDVDPAGSFAAIVRLDRADRARPADVPRIVYTPTMTEWILALARESARAARMLRDTDEFMTPDGRLAVSLVALPLGETDGIVDKVLCHLAAGPS